MRDGNIQMGSINYNPDFKSDPKREQGLLSLPLMGVINASKPQRDIDAVGAPSKELALIVVKLAGSVQAQAEQIVAQADRIEALEKRLDALERRQINRH